MEKFAPAHYTSKYQYIIIIGHWYICTNRMTETQLWFTLGSQEIELYFTFVSLSLLPVVMMVMMMMTDNSVHL